MGTRSWALAGLAAAALAAGPGAATAAAGLWSAPATLGDDAATVGDVAVDADGTAVAAWTAPGGPVRAAVRRGSAAFEPTATLAPDGGQAVSVALDGRGGGLVAWSRNGTLGLAERTAAAPALTEVPAGAGGIAYGPDLAFTGPGEAIVVWAGVDGAVHALARSLGGTTAPLPDVAPGPDNRTAHLDAAGGHAVVAWTHVATTGSQTTTHVRASALAPGGSFGVPTDLAAASSDKAPGHHSGSEFAAQRVVVSAGGAADVLMTELFFQGPPGEVGMSGHVASRTSGTWAPAQRLGSADLAIASGRFLVDLTAGPAGDALYAEGLKRGVSPTMSFSARLRAVGTSGYGDASALYTGAPGEVRAAPLTAGRFLVLMRSGSDLSSRAGSPATGFGDPLVFTGTESTTLLGLAGAPSGLAAALWVTTTGQVQAAVYDDSPDSVSDTIAPVLSGLAVAPRRFTARRRARVRWLLSEPARVRIRVEQTRPGFRRGGRCVARRPRSRRVRRCTRLRHAGTFTRAGRTGRNAVRLDRLVRRRGLRPGRYRVTAVPRDAAGNRGRAKRTRFRVIRRS